MTAGFDVFEVDRRFAFLDTCPEELMPAVVTLGIGTLQERAAGVRTWYDALLDGRLPPPDAWPGPIYSAPVRGALDDLGVARFCKGHADLVLELMKGVLGAFRRQGEVVGAEILEAIRDLEALERARLAEVEDAAARREKRETRPVSIDQDTHRRILERAHQAVAAKARVADDALLSAWGVRVRAWSEVADVFGDLGQMLGRGWDLARGVLQHAGWLNAVRMRELVERLPQLRDIIRALGRLHASDAEISVAERILVPVRRLEEERREVRTPHIPAEMRGVERSGEISRMLPVEASMLGHPKLRLLWHARRAERALLTYRVEGVEYERVVVEREVHEEVDGRRPRPERGPILAVIDTSGSMHGLPEQVAKAIVLEAVRTAHAEKRRCFLYAYSGPRDVLEHELDLAPEGIGRLLTFLQHTFGGGTDIGAMTTVVQRLKGDTWKKADVILVSDGEWRASPPIVAAVAAAKENGTRFHGVQIGNRGRTGMHQICDPVHEFSDWAAAGGWR